MIRLEHIGIAVEDAGEAVQLYDMLLQVRPYKAEAVPREGVRTHFISAGTAKLELLEALGPDSPIARHLERRGAGLHHLAFEVDDVEATLQRLAEQGFRPLTDRPLPGADGKRIFFLHPKQTHGVLVEFCQSTPPTLPLTRIPYREGHLATYACGDFRNPTVVLLHGAEGSTLTETAALARRLEQRFHVLALDFSGHGASDALPSGAPPSIDLLADNVRALLDHHSLKRVHVFGNALGGYAALYLAHRHPAYVYKLILHETNRYAPAGTADGNGSGVSHKALDDAALRHLEAPTLVTAGDRGSPVPLDMTLRLYQQLPDAALALLPATGHSLAEVDLEVYARLVSRWLSNGQ